MKRLLNIIVEVAGKLYTFVRSRDRKTIEVKDPYPSIVRKADVTKVYYLDINGKQKMLPKETLDLKKIFLTNTTSEKDEIISNNRSRSDHINGTGRGIVLSK